MGFNIQERMLICEILILYSKTSLFHMYLQAVVSYKVLFPSNWIILNIFPPPKIKC